MAILVSEADRNWQSISHWIDFSIQVGYRWPVTAAGQRRIAIISMPCDSAAAGLIALGVLIRDLGRRTATNVDDHYDAILRYARQYIECCRDCDVRCQPELKLCGYLPRDTRIFEAMQPGDEYPEARQISERLFRTKAKRRGLYPGSYKWRVLRKSMVPPYDPAKFPNRWWKLRSNKPVRTLTAHIGKDTYSHIHYDSAQARVITVREAARLQSFPDGFIFVGTMNPAFYQIGNAVPPLLARQIAIGIVNSLRNAAIPAIAAE